MEKNFNNLRYQSDWINLLRHLLVRSGWFAGSDTRLDRYACTHKNHPAFVVTLLQGLSPIRFAFMDGQSRITSLFYYERSIVPSHLGLYTPLVTASRMKIKRLSKVWNLHGTGGLADCYVHLPPSQNAGMKVSKAFVLQMRELSRQYCMQQNKLHADLKSITPTTLMDVIMEVIKNSPDTEEETSRKKDIWDQLLGAFHHILETVHQFDTLLQEKLLGANFGSKVAELDGKPFATKVLEIIKSTKEKLMFPRYTESNMRFGNPEFTVVMLVLGTALVDNKVTDLLRDCINNDWMVPISTIESMMELKLGALHPGTFVSLSGDDEAWYYPKFHLVSTIH